MPRLAVDKQTAILQRVRKHMLTYKAERLADGADCEAIAASLGFKMTTLYDRLNDPSKLTLVEVMRIANTLNISIATLIGAREEKINENGD